MYERQKDQQRGEGVLVVGYLVSVLLKGRLVLKVRSAAGQAPCLSVDVEGAMYSMVAVVVRMRCDFPSLKRNDEIAQQGVDGSDLTQGIHCTHTTGIWGRDFRINILGQMQSVVGQQTMGIESEPHHSKVSELRPFLTKTNGRLGQPTEIEPEFIESHASEASSGKNLPNSAVKRDASSNDWL